MCSICPPHPLFLSPSLPPSLSPARPLSCYTPCPADRATTKEGETSAVHVHVQKRKRARNCLRKESQESPAKREKKEEEEGLSKTKRVSEVEAKAHPQEWEAQALRERGVGGQVEQQVWIMLRDVDHLRVLLRSLDSEGDGDDGGVGAEGQVVRILKSTLFEYSI